MITALSIINKKKIEVIGFLIAEIRIINLIYSKNMK